ncbi:hypothetical protein QAD02_006556 [Eretmocerus hayati]|uniref:Uncharacterized protein n=1 Tax=Eretmocerus hayati TaxID=131215 RepID=A0ACC2N3J2_9HYME|nr:hypothetical protein QAD02_006556 [Eretmocerus hayati]
MSEANSLLYNENYKKLAQFRKAINFMYNPLQPCAVDSHPFIFEEIFSPGTDINYALPVNNFSERGSSSYLGYTALHFAVLGDSQAGVRFCIKQKADVTLKNAAGYTALRFAIDKNSCDERRYSNSKGKLRDNQTVIQLLTRQMEINNTSNPKCKNGISHFHIACMFNQTKAVEFFLESGVSVDEAVNMDSLNYSGYTSLHFAARYCNPDVVNILMKYGANVNLKDAKGLTPLQLLIQRNMEILDVLNNGKFSLHKRIADELQDNEDMIDVLYQNSGDYMGLTKLHIACLKSTCPSDTDWLHERVDLNSPVDSDSPICAGYTPLHFAAYSNIETVRTLLKSGASISAKDAKGITPFDLCLERYQPKDIRDILANQESLRDLLFADGTKLLDFVQAMQDDASFSKYLENLSDINTYVSLDSSLWAGYTPLHLAVVMTRKVIDNNDELYNYHDFANELEDESYPNTDEEWDSDECNDVENLFKKGGYLTTLCLVKGSDLTIQDASGLSPLHLAVFQLKRNIVELLLNYHEKKIVNVINWDHISHFHIACAVGNDKLVEKFLQNGVDVNSPIKAEFGWFEPESLNDCVTINKIDSTPLHIALEFEQKKISEMLLKADANIFAKDSDGVTPVHLALKIVNHDLVRTMLMSIRFCSGAYPRENCWPPPPENPNESTKDGLSFFHMACLVNDSLSVEEYLALDVDVNEVVKPEYEINDSSETDFVHYIGHTPLHFAVDGHAYDVVDLLIRHGADIHRKDRNGYSPLHRALETVVQHRNVPKEFLNSFISVLNFEADRCIDDTKLMPLHVACVAQDRRMVEKLLEAGADVNAQVDSKSPIWRGYTPLHTLLASLFRSRPTGDAEIIAEMLLKHGADINLKDAWDSTPLNTAVTSSAEPEGIINMFLRCHEAFDHNPVDRQGVSHFHIACMRNDLTAVQEFVKRGADINCPKDYFAYDKSGYSPLHLAMDGNVNVNKEVVRFLLDNGADVNAQTADGSRPLHIYLRTDLKGENAIEHRLDLIEMYLSYPGVDINARNMYRETALAKLFKQKTGKGVTCLKELEIYLVHGARVNLVDQLTSSTLLGIAFDTKFAPEYFKKVCELAVDLTDVDPVFGFNAIHNLVSYRQAGTSGRSWKEYAWAIDLLLRKGCKLDQQDKEGKTPLHVAVDYKNSHAVEGLLAHGPDINLVDNRGRTALTEFENSAWKCMGYPVFREIVMYVHKLLSFKLSVSDLNQNFFKTTRKSAFYDHMPDEYKIEADRMKSVKICGAYSLRDFLSERAVIEYSIKPRHAIDDLFRDSAELRKQYPELSCLLMLLYRKARRRHMLVQPAKDSLSEVTGINLPDLCSEVVLQYLTIEELEKLVAAGTEDRNPHKRQKVQHPSVAGPADV